MLGGGVHFVCGADLGLRGGHFATDAVVIGFNAYEKQTPKSNTNGIRFGRKKTFSYMGITF